MHVHLLGQLLTIGGRTGQAPIGGGWPQWVLAAVGQNHPAGGLGTLLREQPQAATAGSGAARSVAWGTSLGAVPAGIQALIVERTAR